MNCAICRNGMTADGHVTITLERGSAVLIFRNVPARVCDNCGEEYLSSKVSKALLRRAEEEVERGVSLEMLEYAA